MTEREALKLALEALEKYARDFGSSDLTVKAMYVVRQALAQPERTWVGLTDEDVEEVERWVEFKEEGSGRIPTGKLVRYIEAKLKEKNT